MYRSEKAVKQEDEATEAIQPLSTKIGDIRRCRQLATEITQQGAKLFQLLKKEETGREERQRVVGSDLELEHVANEMRTQIATVSESVTTVERQIADIASDESNLEAKIEKLEQDRQFLLQRNQPPMPPPQANVHHGGGQKRAHPGGGQSGGQKRSHH